MDVDETAQQLSPAERKILLALRGATDSRTLAAVAKDAALSETEAYSAASWLQRKAALQLEERPTFLVSLGAEGKSFLEGRFPERRAFNLAQARGGSIALADLQQELSPGVAQVALAWWKRKRLGAIEKRGDVTVLVADPKAPGQTGDEALLEKLSGKPSWPEVEAHALDAANYELLKGRPNVLERREVKNRFLGLTDAGRQLSEHPSLSAELVGELTPELLRSGAWRTGQFQSYNVGTASPQPAPAKPHPLQQIIDRVRTIFVEMGFQEIEDDYVQSAFWNMDALFIPQDHPARDMQDTFFLRTPSQLPVDEVLFEKLSKVHKTGAGTGSRGWGQALEMDESRRALLRTHTTVGTIRYLATGPQPPVRVFSVGRVFRHETMDATHLPEFHQIEGIATEEGADFPLLLGILQEFYRRLGFEKLRWRPAYFPYTEPSMEVEVWTGSKWMELGGCGIFRPEVTKPLGVTTPVLAWGLGLERLAMLRLGLKDIRDLYVSDVDWLRRQPLL